MKSIKGLFILAVISLLFDSCSSQQSFEPLFQESGNNWTREGDAEWRFENNELIGSISKGAGYVMTKTSYNDFILELEFYPDSTINSGIFVRCKNRELSGEDCYENNIWDLHPKQENRTGAVVSRATPLEKVNTLNKWNTYKIKNQKDHLQAWINGKLVVDFKNQELNNGPIGLQASGKGVIKFRNVKIATLE